MIDMHTHLDLYQNAIHVAQETNKNNNFTLCVTTSPRAWIIAKKYFSLYKNVKVGLGFHPELVEKKKDELSLFLDNICNTKYIGEIGIDNTERNKETFNIQKDIFERIIKKCEIDGEKIISIHSRSAEEPVTDILSQYRNIGSVIMHWYSGNISTLDKLLNLGCYFSINPLMCNTKRGLSIISKIPMNRLLIETDGPFTEFNGKIRNPWENQDLIRCLSDIWIKNKEEVETTIFDNCNRMIKIIQEPTQNDTSNKTRI
jgi:TatD DNase family protein